MRAANIPQAFIERKVKNMGTSKDETQIESSVKKEQRVLGAIRNFINTEIGKAKKQHEEIEQQIAEMFNEGIKEEERDSLRIKISNAISSLNSIIEGIEKEILTEDTLGFKPSSEEIQKWMKQARLEIQSSEVQSEIESIKNNLDADSTKLEQLGLKVVPSAEESITDIARANAAQIERDQKRQEEWAKRRAEWIAAAKAAEPAAQEPSSMEPTATERIATEQDATVHREVSTQAEQEDSTHGTPTTTAQSARTSPIVGETVAGELGKPIVQKNIEPSKVPEETVEEYLKKLKAKSEYQPKKRIGLFSFFRDRKEEDYLARVDNTIEEWGKKMQMTENQIKDFELQKEEYIKNVKQNPKMFDPNAVQYMKEKILALKKIMQYQKVQLEKVSLPNIKRRGFFERPFFNKIFDSELDSVANKIDSTNLGIINFVAPPKAAKGTVTFNIGGIEKDFEKSRRLPEPQKPDKKPKSVQFLSAMSEVNTNKQESFTSTKIQDGKVNRKKLLLRSPSIYLPKKPKKPKKPKQ